MAQSDDHGKDDKRQPTPPTIIDGIKKVSEYGRVMTRAFLRTGMIREVRPRGVARYVGQRLKGPIGPAALLRVHAANHPDKLAVIDPRGAVTYGELDDRIARLAVGLQKRLGLGRGGSAIMMLHNRREMIEIQSAMGRIGGNAVAVSWRSTPAELAYLIENSSSTALFVDTAIASNILSAKDELAKAGAHHIVVVGENTSQSEAIEYESLFGNERMDGREGDEGAVVIYTSGTTGRPKGAVRKFPKNTTLAVMSFILETPLAADDRHLAICPMYHSTAYGFANFNFVVGGTLVIEHAFDPERFLQVVSRDRVTNTVLVPTLIHRLVALPEKTTRAYNLSSLRAVFACGAPLSGALARQFIERFGPILYNVYGSTETGLNTIANSEDLLKSPGTIGRAIRGNEISLQGPGGAPVARGQTGELFVRNLYSVAGYHKDDDATRDASRDGFFSVGDLAHQDEWGMFHIDGRTTDMIISGGVNVYPAEVESVLTDHPAVREAAVIGVPDDEWGERVRAFVSLESEIRADALVAHCKTKLAGPKCPKEIVILPELPKNATGKILKRELKTL